MVEGLLLWWKGSFCGINGVRVAHATLLVLCAKLFGSPGVGLMAAPAGEGQDGLYHRSSSSGDARSIRMIM